MKKNSLTVVLYMARLSIAAKINKARVIVQSVESHPEVFENPRPALNVMYTAIDELSMAAADASDGGKTKTKIMHSKEDLLMQLMHDLAAYVQMVADGDEGIVHLTGMDVKVFPGRKPRAFSVSQGKDSGEVLVTFQTVRNAVYFWQYCSEPVTEEGWINVGNTMKSSKSIRGLTPGTKYWFRVNYIDRDGEHPFNEPMSLIVV